MSDPRAVGPQQRSANHSQLMAAKSKMSQGEKVNFCPIEPGPEGVEHLDDLGYCDHLVGITLPGDVKLMEPMVTDERGRRRTLGEQKVPVLKTDKLVRITTCHRVYRDVQKEAKK